MSIKYAAFLTLNGYVEARRLEDTTYTFGYIVTEKLPEQTECQIIYYQVRHDAVICGTGLMLAETRRGVSRL